MGTIRKIGREFYIEFYARGLLYQQKAGDDKFRAANLLNVIEGKIARGEMETIDRDVEYDIFLDSFLDHIKINYPIETTVRYQKLILHFTFFLRGNYPLISKLSAITPRVVEDYRFYLETPKHNFSNRAINFTLLLLRDVFSHAIKVGYLNDNPSLHVNLIFKKSIFSKSLEVQYCLENEAHTNNSFEFFVMRGLLHTGLSFNELIALRWDWFNETENTFYIPDSRWAEPRRIVVLSSLLSVVKFLRSNQKNDYVWKTQEWNFPEILNKINRHLENLDLTVQSFRHSFAKSRLEQNMDLLALAKIMGKADILKVYPYHVFIPKKVVL